MLARTLHRYSRPRPDARYAIPFDIKHMLKLVGRGFGSVLDLPSRVQRQRLPLEAALGAHFPVFSGMVDDVVAGDPAGLAALDLWQDVVGDLPKPRPGYSHEQAGLVTSVLENLLRGLDNGNPNSIINRGRFSHERMRNMSTHPVVSRRLAGLLPGDILGAGPDLTTLLRRRPSPIAPVAHSLQHLRDVAAGRADTTETGVDTSLDHLYQLHDRLLQLVGGLRESEHGFGAAYVPAGLGPTPQPENRAAYHVRVLLNDLNQLGEGFDDG
jgi:hypothetical protein